MLTAKIKTGCICKYGNISYIITGVDHFNAMVEVFVLSTLENGSYKFHEMEDDELLDYPC
jgi:hypothetical protein